MSDILKYRGNISSTLSRNSVAPASEFPDNVEEMFTRYDINISEYWQWLLNQD